MQQAKRQIALANAEFKAATAGMDEWSKSADGINAKLTQLDKTLAGQKSVLSNLEEQYRLTVEQMGEGSKEADNLKIKIENQKASIAGTEKQIRNYTQVLEDLENEVQATGGDLDDLSDSAQDASDSAKDAEGGFTVLKGALANLVADGISKAVDAFKELAGAQSEASNIFQASTGATAEAMGQYNDAIEAIYKNNFGESLQDVAEKMAKVKEITGEMDSSKLQEMTESAITLEDTFGMDMNETLRGVQSLVTHFGITATEAFDLMASGAQNGLNYTDELGDNIAEYAGKFAEAGYTTEEYFQLLKNGTSGGAYNLDKVNDAINEVTTRLADGTIEDAIGHFTEETQYWYNEWKKGNVSQKKVIDEIIADVNVYEDEQERINIATKAFGTMAEDGGIEFIKSLSAVGDAFDDTAGKMDEVKEIRYDDVMSQLSGIGRSIKMDIIAPVVNKLLPPVKKGMEWIIKHNDIVKAGIVGIGSAFVAWNGVTMIQGVVGAIKAFQLANEGATVAQWALNTAMNANPIGILITIISGLVSAFIVLWNTSDEFRGFFIDLWDSIKSKVIEAWETYLQPILSAIGEAFVTLGSTILEIWETYLQPVFNAIGTLFMNTWTKYLQPALVAVGKAFVTVFNGIKTVWDNVLQPVFKAIGSVFKWLWEVVLKVALVAMAALFTAVWKGIELAWNNILKPVFEAIASVFSWLWNNVLSPTLSALKSAFDTVFKAIKRLWDKILHPVFSAIGSAFKTMWDNVLSPTIDSVSDAFDTMASGIKTVWSGLWNKGLKPIFNSILGGIDFLVNGVIDGINFMIDALNDLSFDVPDWVPEIGGETFGFDIDNLDNVDIPKLAKGGIVSRATRAIIGESGKEAIIPLENNTGWLDEVASRIVAKSEAGRLGSQTVNNNYKYEFNQTNNSPKALSRLEIYRQTRNLTTYGMGAL